MGKILIVDDSEIIRAQVSKIVANAGYEVVEAHDGQRALELAESNNYDLVITDYNMPGLNGVELVKKLREHPEYREKQMIMLTTEAGTELKKKGNEVGIRAWMVKPVDEILLVKVLNKLMPKAA